MNNTPDSPKSHEPPDKRRSPLHAPSARLTAALAAAMLAIGVVVGAAIGPAPSPSFALSRLVPLLPGLLASKSSAGSGQPSATTAQATTARKRRKHKRTHKAVASEATSPTSTSETETTTPTSTSTTPTSTTKTKTAPLPPVSKVWLIELDGSGFSEAETQPSAAPYIDTQAAPAGTLLSGWSAIEGSTFASDAALIAGSSPQLLDTIVQPPCPASPPEGEGPAGAACAAGTPGALTAADEFLKATLPTITSTAAYKENGLVVVTFASVTNAAATGLPSGAATATLTTTPPAGVLLISPFVTAGATSKVVFEPTSPKQSLEKLLRR